MTAIWVLTMDKGYGALPDLIRENAEPGDIGKTLMKAGMKMSSVVPPPWAHTDVQRRDGGR